MVNVLESMETKSNCENISITEKNGPLTSLINNVKCFYMLCELKSGKRSRDVKKLLSPSPPVYLGLSRS
jgi:hypothetical protein